MAKWYSVREKPGPAGLHLVDRVDVYEDGHPQGEALHHSRNVPLWKPDSDGDIVWDGSTILHATPTQQAEIDAWRAAQQQQAALQQASDDLAGYGPMIGALAQYLAAFPDIPSGADYPTCMRVMAEALSAATPEQYQQLNIAKDMAQTIYERTLEPAGILGDRLWAAIAILAQQ